eukprot:7743932-Pyramimonas_sp.AAC.1
MSVRIATLEALLGRSQGPLGPSLGPSPALLGLRVFLGTSWAVFGRYWGSLGCSGRCQGETG